MNSLRLALWALPALLWCFPALAEAPPSCEPGEVDCGRAAFARGTEAFDRRDYLTAAAWFAAAANADAHPVVVFNLALTEARLERFVSAAARFRALLALDTLEPVLRQRIGRELSLAEAGIARVTFELPNPVDTRIFLDGSAVTPALDEIAVDPGKHRLLVENAGDVVFDQEIDLMRGERVRLRVGSRTRAIDVVVVPPKPHVPPAPSSPPPEVDSRSGLSPIWFYAAAASTAVVASVSIWSGVDTQNAYDDYREALPRLDQAGADERVRDGHARELRTNVLFGATALFAAGTAVVGLVLVDWSARPSSGAALTLTPLGVSARARF